MKKEITDIMKREHAENLAKARDFIVDVVPDDRWNMSAYFYPGSKG